MIHAYASYSAPTPLQEGVAEALRHMDSLPPAETQAEARLFEANFKMLSEALTSTGATVSPAGGGYFLVADVSHTGKDAMDYCRWLAQTKKVGCLPLSVFCVEPSPATRSVVRFAICKRTETIAEACRRITSNDVD